MSELAPGASIALKRCPKCNEEKPGTLDFFYRGTQWPSGLRPYCKTCEKKLAKSHSQANPEKAKVARKRWVQKNPISVAAIRKRTYWKDVEKSRSREVLKNKKRNRCPMFRLNMRMRSRIKKCLNGKAGRSWLSMVPYTKEELLKHIERQFQPGMTWENMGEWHIDHILPVSGFKFRDENDAEFKACWALTNLAPRWAEDNLRKGNKRIFLL